MTENELARIVFDAGMKVHKALGAGLLENVSLMDNYSALCAKLCAPCGKKITN